MSRSIPTLIRQHLQANDSVQDPIDFEEITSRLEADKPVHAVSPTHHIANRGVWVAAAAAVITLLLFGLIPLLPGGEPPQSADTLPPPTTPTTPPQSTIGDAEPFDEEGVIVPEIFTTVPSDPIAIQGSLTWRTVELPAPGLLRAGLDDRIYLLAEDVVWVSDDGTDWAGYPAPSSDGYQFAIGQDRLITAGGGGGISDSETDEGPDVLLPVTVTIYDVSGVNSGGITLTSRSTLADSDGAGVNSMAIGPQGAVVATSRGVYYSEQGDQWTPIEGLPETEYADVIATSDGFYITDRTTLFFSTDGIQWMPVHEWSGPIRAVGRWGNTAVADDGETLWRVTPEGGEALHIGNTRTGPSAWIWQITGSPLGIMSVQADTGRYLYSRDGVDWEDMLLPEGWTVNNVFVEEPIAMNSATILLIASPSNSQDGATDDGNRVLTATP